MICWLICRSPGAGSGFLVNRASEKCCRWRGPPEDWAFPTAAQISRSLSAATGRTVYESRDPANRSPTVGHGCVRSAERLEDRRHAAAPAILGQTLSIIGPLSLLIIVSSVFYAIVAALNRHYTRPIAEISRVAGPSPGAAWNDRCARAQKTDRAVDAGFFPRCNVPCASNWMSCRWCSMSAMT